MNNNYTEDFCLKEIKKIYGKIIKDPKVWSLNSIIEKESYTSGQVYGWQDLFNNTELKHLTSKIKDILKNRLFEKSCEKKLNAQMAQFLAINHYDFISEKTEAKLDSKVQLNTEELQCLADGLADNLINLKKNQVK